MKSKSALPRVVHRIFENVWKVPYLLLLPPISWITTFQSFGYFAHVYGAYP